MGWEGRRGREVGGAGGGTQSIKRIASIALQSKRTRRRRHDDMQTGEGPHFSFFARLDIAVPCAGSVLDLHGRTCICIESIDILPVEAFHGLSRRFRGPRN